MRELSEHDKALLIDGVPNANLALFCPGLQGRGGTLLDRSKNGNNGTITNAAWMRTPRGLYAIDYGSRVDFGNALSLQITNNLSVLIWIKTPATFLTSAQWGDLPLFSKYAPYPGLHSWMLALVNPLSGTLPLNCLEISLARADTGVASYIAAHLTALLVSTWYHIGFTFASGALAVYLNGAAVSLSTRPGKTDIPATLYNTLLTVAIRATNYGALSPAASPIIYSGSPVLTAAQVLRIYTRQRHPFGV